MFASRTNGSWSCLLIAAMVSSIFVMVQAKVCDVHLVDNLVKEHVVPDAMESKPKACIEIEWLTVDKEKEVHAEQGNELKPRQVKDLPKKISYNHENDKLYTLVMIDLDAPSRKDPKAREFLHYLVVNIPQDQVDKGNTLVEYIGAGPPKDTGLHRYVFMVYKQVDKISGVDLKVNKSTAKGRPHFSMHKFAKEHQLSEPMAANFFQAQYDDYVPTLHAQLH